jgi:IS30 family transposase
VIGRHDDFYTQAQRAQEAAHARRVAASREKMRLKSKTIRHYVELHLREARWSPEIIAGRLTILGFKISDEAIYNFINIECPELKSCLHIAGRSRRRRRARQERRHKSPAAPKVSIELLPDEAKARTELGHFELDAVIGRRGGTVIQNKVDRCSRRMFIDKASSLVSTSYSQVLLERFQREKVTVKTILQDNGPEHADHVRIDATLGCSSYFCHPYCASERGTVENRNGAIRRYFPKGTDFDDIPLEYFEWVEDHFNNRPMKILNFRTPNEVWNEGLKSAAA